MSSGSGAARTFLYFAYGSNLCSERIRLNNKTAIMKSVGLLKMNLFSWNPDFLQAFQILKAKLANRWVTKARVDDQDMEMTGYRLGFGFMSKRWKGAAANIYPDQESHVYGVLWELSLSDKESLDTQEGVDDSIYERAEIEVEVDGNLVSCCVYKLTETCKQKSLETHGANLLPSTVYKNVIIRGAKEHKLPQKYIEFLENIPDNGYNGKVDVNLVEPTN